LCQSRAISAFPTVLLFKNHRFIEYEGERELTAMKAWLETMFQPTLLQASVAELEQMAKEKNYSSFFMIRTSRPKFFENILEGFKGAVLAGVEPSAEESITAY